MFWEHLNDIPPGKHLECMVLTKVNGKRWDDWKSDFQLDFNTDSFTIQGTVLQLNEISKLVQAPTAANGWETIWWFNDPSAYPHSYAVSFEFTPPKKNTIAAKPLIRTQPKPVKKDTVVPEYIPNSISFEVGKAILTKESLPELNKIYESLKDSRYMIKIYGHTNNVGEKAGLKKLSEERAFAVYNYLLNKRISKDRMSYYGNGDEQPIASNDTEEGKAKNRRVEIRISK